jgi:hypothetical protein
MTLMMKTIAKPLCSMWLNSQPVGSAPGVARIPSKFLFRVTVMDSVDDVESCNRFPIGFETTTMSPCMTFGLPWMIVMRSLTSSGFLSRP